MSELNAWLLGGALLLFTGYFVNAFAYRCRAGTFLRAEARENLLRGKVGAGQLIASAFVVTGGCIYLALPIVAPHSAFSLWLSEPFSTVIYIVWCLLLSAVTGSSLAVAAFLSQRRKGKAEPGGVV